MTFHALGAEKRRIREPPTAAQRRRLDAESWLARTVDHNIADDGARSSGRWSAWAPTRNG